MEKSQIQSFESEVISLVRTCCSTDEPIEPFHNYKINNYSEFFDIWLPNGCSKLHLPAKTAIEIKYNLLFDTIERLEFFVVKYGINKLLVVTNDENKSLNRKQCYKYQKSIGNNIEIRTISELRKSIDMPLDSPHNIINGDIVILDSANKAFKTNRVTIFVGAGISKDANLVEWKELQNALLENNKDKITLEEINEVCRQSDIVAGRYIKSITTGIGRIGSEEAFDKLIKRALYKNSPKHSALIDTIVRMVKHKNVESVISYNYDDLLEREFDLQSIRPIYEGGRTSLNETPIYHIHGYAPHGDNSCSKLVFSEEDYHEQYKNSFLWSNIEQLHALNRNTCFFIGLSMTDPNLRRLLDFSHNSYSIESSAPHYAFLKRDPRVRSQVNLQTEKVLNSLGVNVIWYDDHKKLPSKLNDVIK